MSNFRNPSTAGPGGCTQAMCIRDLVEDALQMSAPGLARRGIILERDFAEVPAIVIDQHRVLQILTNLIRNAKHALDSAIRSEKRLIVRIRMNERRMVEIAVEDNGIGIPPENLPCIFSRGFTTKKDGHGFGLHSGSLAAIGMGGFLRGYSEGDGQGASFVLELPLGSPVRNTVP